MKVIFNYKNGTKREMESRFAVILQRMNMGFYETREMPSEMIVAKTGEIDALDRDSLIRLADERGVKIHRNSGIEKLREALR